MQTRVRKLAHIASLDTLTRQEERKRVEKKVDDLTQAAIAELDAAMKVKEKEVVTV